METSLAGGLEAGVSGGPVLVWIKNQIVYLYCVVLSSSKVVKVSFMLTFLTFPEGSATLQVEPQVVTGQHEPNSVFRSIEDEVDDNNLHLRPVHHARHQHGFKHGVKESYSLPYPRTLFRIISISRNRRVCSSTSCPRRMSSLRKGKDYTLDRSLSSSLSLSCLCHEDGNWWPL